MPGGASLLTAENNIYGRDMLLPSGKPPCAGDIMKMPKLANTFRLLAENGRDGFYKGEVRNCGQGLGKAVQTV